METTIPSTPVSKKTRWTGYVLSALACLMMLFSGGIKLVLPPGVPEHFTQQGWPLNYVTGLGCVELSCAIIYLLPRTAILGAILLTGYLGGAIATHVRIGEGGVAIFPLVLGIMLWAGLWLRDLRLRALIPFRR